MSAHLFLVGHVGTGGDHNLAVVGVLWLPAMLVLARTALRTAARGSHRLPARMLATWQAADASTRLTLLLVATTAVVHLALIPDHLGDRTTAALFGVDVTALVLVFAAALLELPGWRLAAFLLLAAGVAAYAVYVIAGLERPDAVALVTKLVELAAMSLLVERATWHWPLAAQAAAAQTAPSTPSPRLPDALTELALYRSRRHTHVQPGIRRRTRRA